LTLEDWAGINAPTRPQLWAAALRLGLQHPVWGVGPDNFRHLYPRGLRPVRADPATPFDQRLHANSLYFETLADLGLAGLGALGLLIAAVAGAARRCFRAPRTPGASDDPLFAACAVAVGGFFVHGLLDWFLEFTPTYGLYAILLGLLAAGATGARGAATAATNRG
jgi:O-antigen ligase